MKKIKIMKFILLISPVFRRQRQEEPQKGEARLDHKLRSHLKRIGTPPPTHTLENVMGLVGNLPGFLLLLSLNALKEESPPVSKCFHFQIKTLNTVQE